MRIVFAMQFALHFWSKDINIFILHFQNWSYYSKKNNFYILKVIPMQENSIFKDLVHMNAPETSAQDGIQKTLEHQMTNPLLQFISSGF